MLFYDSFFSLGRSNGAIGACPCTQEQALALMERYDVARALVYHT
ncbi:hypothetical protein LCGC14_2703540, partial [marine sediment metagenome]